MSPTSSFDAKERVKQATDIVDLVGNYVPLRREGRMLKGICPWHDDTRPSLQVNPDRQTFKCWVCDIGGDVFSFVMKREGVDFPQALAMLAERAGIDLSPTHGGAAAAGKSEKQALYQATAWAEERYHRFLLENPAAEPARRYLQQRGITLQSIGKYRIGCSPNEWQWLLDQAAGTPHSAKLLEQVGLVAVSPSTGRRYDRFKGRVLFSIRDEQGRPIATGGRILPDLADDRTAKYINSPETPLFSKSNHLYGLDLAKDAISRCRHALVMEGYTDCVVAAQCGFDNALAVLGTALGERHVRLLARFADRITLVLDGDEAGQRRTNEILELFIAANVDLRVATLPDQLDPCDFLLSRGAEAFQQSLDGAVDAFEHKLLSVTRDVDPGSGSHAAASALEEVLQLLARGPAQAARNTNQQVRINQLLARLARKFLVPEEVLRDRVTAERRRLRRPEAGAAAAASTPRAGADAWERELIEILLHEPEAVPRAAESIAPEELVEPRCREIFDRCCTLSRAGVLPDFQRLMLEFDEPEAKALLIEFDERARQRTESGVELAAQLPLLLESFAGRRQQRQARTTLAALRNKSLSAEQEEQHLEELLRTMRLRQGISEPTDG